ncbi:hypothetical protein AB0E75_02355 [Streptomyces griseoviridis]|jgi:hypothetical protein|uniref:Uncharacterized protein n=3 Tax=Streptomyces TaxID=1883 RepID=A0ABT9LJF7_STRGD|nr:MULTISPECIES: hypothetical protein [Streptomyces]MDP9683853.1 hypothetical protein [Streptomyces griseoviridis]GGS25977.1 hypothetical protein GCM10010238_12880 [Streptomyces niveoruber]GGS86242.1 hypothetical protein GCM10010240_19660 [Streptomyces griseoviridis]GGU40874.1 hypothetical protein GCM10010259_34670 [Streptomyces daghestanicus]GHI31195.1 hypothetical protein Sdagh_29250 [Streptomyces daghestanicus]
MRSRLIITTAGAALAVGLAATQVHAAGAGAAACGYDVCESTTNGSATLYLDRWAGGVWEVCDDASDGMRAKATVRYGGQTLNLQTTAGYGSCSSGQSLYPTPRSGAVVSYTVWVQDGAGGTPRYSSSGSYTW